jgi:NAD-dependent SIR2 family protein deacetylase
LDHNGRVPQPTVDRLVEFLATHRRVLVLTGAGCSTESGIPDYRDLNGERKHAQPIMYQQFVGSETVRRRDWARSVVGWARVANAAPNRAHLALASLEEAGFVHGVITQNVDGLHARAGSRRVIDLHGRLDTVQCLGCRALTSRADFQAQLVERNAHLERATVDAITPDGDAAVAHVDYSSVDVPACPQCGGVLKPHVVFFGEGVPPQRVERAFDLLDRADALMVVGSSLMVFSGYRFVQAAVRASKPVAAINLGRTRADDVIELKVEEPCGDTLATIDQALQTITRRSHGNLTNCSHPGDACPEREPYPSA